MPGTLTKITRWQILDAGVIAPGAKLYTYLSGTSTPHPVYNNADLDVSHAHTNPVVADAEGVLPVLFLDDVAYRFLVTDAAGATIYPAQDDIFELADVAASTQNANLVYAGPTSGSAALPTFRALVLADLPALPAAPITCEGRLTLTTGVAVTSADVTGASTLYFTPYHGNRISLYDGSAWDTTAFAEVSLALSLIAATNYDVFLYDNAGTLTLETVAWSTDTARAVALAVQDGVLVKTGALTRRYLGTIRASGTDTTEDSLAKRFVWNHVHRVRRAMQVLEATNSWTYTTATYRQANGSNANQLAIVVGVAGEALQVQVAAEFSQVDTARVAVGADSTSVPMPGSIGRALSQGGGARGAAASVVNTIPAVGYHFYAWLEHSVASGTTTWYGDDGGTTTQSGITGHWSS
jgi:hypothetical protein